MENHEALYSKLNTLLASNQVHYQNLRALHWNIKGAQFFELHVKYEEMYNRAHIIIDELAEMLLTLGQTPLHRFEDYVKHSVLPENGTLHEGKSGISYILRAQQELLILEKELLHLANELGEESVSAFMSDLIREKEKSNWMLKAWLGGN